MNENGDRGGLRFIAIANDQATATLCVQGAHLTHWQPRAEAEPVLFLAEKVRYLRGKPIRGGIPLCWPWFGPSGIDKSLPSHGFARNLDWLPGEQVLLASGATRLSLRLVDSEATRALWPHRFSLEYSITVGTELDVELRTTNTGEAPFVISEALHTYFRIGDIAAVEVRGLAGTEYHDSAAGGVLRREPGAIAFDGEVDRVFVDTEANCTLVDAQLGRRIEIGKLGSRSTVIWNPGEHKAAQFADLGADPATRLGWRQMVCVETANALRNAIELAPGATAVIGAHYRVSRS